MTANDDSQIALRHEHNQRVFNRFSFFKPRTVLWMVIATAFLVFLDQGQTFGCLVAIREDPLIAGVMGDGSPSQHRDHAGNTSTPGANVSNSSGGGTKNNGTTLHHHHHGPVLSSALAGVYASIFMLGFAVFTLVAASLTMRVSSNRLMALGLLAWTVSVTCVSLAPNYYLLVFFRFCVGSSEAFFSFLALTLIDNAATSDSKGFWISMYFAMLAFASAAGLALGGYVSSHVPMHTAAHGVFRTGGWRLSFQLEVPLAVALTLMFFMLPEAYNVYQLDDDDDISSNDENCNEGETTNDSQRTKRIEQQPSRANNTVSSSAFFPRRGDDDLVQQGDSENDVSSDINNNNINVVASGGGRDDETRVIRDRPLNFMLALRELLCNNADFAMCCIGYACIDFMLTGYSSWSVALLVEAYGLSQETAGQILGGIIGGCGLVGSVTGGLLVDWFGGARPETKNGISKCMLWSVTMAFSGLLIGLGALLSTTHLGYIAFFVPAVFVLCMNSAGVAAAVLQIAPAGLRPLASGVELVVMNIVGDMPAPTVIGALSRAFSENCRDKPEHACLALAAAAANASHGPPPSWWEGRCRWIEASLKGQNSYCANDTSINRAVIVASALCCILVPAWLAVAYRRWNKVEPLLEEEAGAAPPGEKTPLL